MSRPRACSSARRESLRRCAGALLALWLGAGAAATRAQDEGSDSGNEAAVKAAYLYRLVSYVAWPPSPRGNAGPLIIGTLDSTLVHAELLRLLPGRKVDGRDIEVRRFQEGDAPHSIHLLYLGRTATPRPASWQQWTNTRGLLIVTDQADGLAAGAAINFVRVRGRVRFEAAPEAAERNGLKLSSRLLAVAERVVSSP